MAINPQILCLDNYDYQKDIKEILSQTEGKLVVIDNADILLDDDTRKYISLDDKNQYLIIGRNPKNLFATKENLFELVSEKVGEQTVEKSSSARKTGFSVWTGERQDKQVVHAIFDSGNYTEKFEQDLVEAEKSIVISSPNIRQDKVDRLLV